MGLVDRSNVATVQVQEKSQALLGFRNMESVKLGPKKACITLEVD